MDETVTTSAAFAHLDARREKDMPLMQSSVGFVLVRTTCQDKQNQSVSIIRNRNTFSDQVTRTSLPVHQGTCKMNNNSDLSPLR